MDPTRRLERIGPLLGFAIAAAILLFGLGRHGIWDPTELTFADTVREHGEFLGRAPWHGKLVALGFARFGIHDWSGRLFGALSCLGCSLAAMGIARRHFDARTAAYAAIAAAASPLVVLNARWMMGDAAALGAQALFGLATFVLAFQGTADTSGSRKTLVSKVVAGALFLPLAVVAVLVRGALLEVLPPLLAVLAITLIEPQAEGGARRMRYVVSAIAAGLLVAVVVAVFRDAAMYSVLLGGVPGGESPPSFEKYLQVAVHTLAPWSALFVIGAARSIATDAPATDEAMAETERVRLALVLWAVFSFGAATLFASRYGTSGFFAVVPVAVLAAVTLREAEVGRSVELAGIVVFAMVLALVLRDFALYPASPLAGVPVPAPILAPDFQPKRIWSVLFLGFGAAFGFGAASRLADEWPPIREAWPATRELVKDFARRHTVSAILVVAVLALMELAVVVLGIAGPYMHLPSITVRVCRVLAVVLPLGVLAGSFGVNLVLRGFSRLGSARMLPTLAFGVAIGAFVQGPFLVDLSGELSPREVYATYTRLHRPGEELVEFDIASRAAAYYVGRSVRTVETQDALVQHLNGRGRRWAIFRRNILPEFDRLYRAASGRHVVIADARNLEVVLATNAPIPGHPDENPLARAIRSGTVRPQHPTSIRFSEVELVGYDLHVPNGDSVGAGQSFRITWYWKVLRQPTRDWRVFLHIDGAGLRLNGDHDPVEGLLPMRQWQVGDTIADEQELAVPPTYPSVDFTLFVGFYNGNDRMRIESGNHTPDDRAIAGTLPVR